MKIQTQASAALARLAELIAPLWVAHRIGLGRFDAFTGVSRRMPQPTLR